MWVTRITLIVISMAPSKEIEEDFEAVKNNTVAE